MTSSHEQGSVLSQQDCRSGQLRRDAKALSASAIHRQSLHCEIAPIPFVYLLAEAATHENRDTNLSWVALNGMLSPVPVSVLHHNHAIHPLMKGLP
jgi:hypothetical protein